MPAGEPGPGGLSARCAPLLAASGGSARLASAIDENACRPRPELSANRWKMCRVGSVQLELHADARPPRGGASLPGVGDVCRNLAPILPATRMSRRRPSRDRIGKGTRRAAKQDGARRQSSRAVQDVWGSCQWSATAWEAETAIPCWFAERLVGFRMALGVEEDGGPGGSRRWHGFVRSGPFRSCDSSPGGVSRLGA